MACTARHLGAHGVALLSYRLWSNPQLLPVERANTRETQMPRAVFLILCLARLLIYYYMHVYVIPMVLSETIFEILPEDVAQTALLVRLSELTAREAVVRAYTAVSWIWESIVFLDGANAALSFLSVLSGFDQPSDWPSLSGDRVRHADCETFGPSSGISWRLDRTEISGMILAQRGLRLPPDSFVSKIVVAFAAFLLSGLSHAAVSWRLGNRDVLDIQWFMLNFGCMLGRDDRCLDDSRSGKTVWLGT